MEVCVLELSVSNFWPKKYKREESESQIISHVFDSLLGRFPFVTCSSFFSFPSLTEVVLDLALTQIIHGFTNCWIHN